MSKHITAYNARAPRSPQCFTECHHVGCARGGAPGAKVSEKCKSVLGAPALVVWVEFCDYRERAREGSVPARTQIELFSCV